MRWLKYLAVLLLYSQISMAAEPVLPTEGDGSYARLGVGEQSFVSQAFPLTDKNYSLILADFLRHNPDDSFRYDIGAKFALSQSAFNSVNVREIYLTLKNSETSEIRIGRSTWDWNFADTEFGLGIWQPLYKAEILRRSQQGLTGIFLSQTTVDHQLMFFVSPVYIPSQAASYSLNDKGKFDNSNPWFPNPPTTFRPIQGSTATADINYHINRPSDSEIINNGIVGGWAAMHLTSDLDLIASAIIKPDNNLLIAYSGSYNVLADQVHAEVYPKVQRESIASAGLDWKHDTFRLQATYAYLNYYSLFEDSSLTFTKYDRYVHLGAGKLTIPWNNFKFSAAYMLTSIRDQHLQGPLDFSQAPLTSQLPLTEALKVGASVKLSESILNDVESGIYYLWSKRNQLEQISFDITSRWRKAYVFFVKTELLNAAKLTVDNSNELAQYSANDFVELGAMYEF